MDSTTARTTFSEEVFGLPNCEEIRICIQCGTCAATCPVGGYMTYSPRKLFAMVRADAEDQVLRSDTIWYCASCYSCSVRCPKEIKITDAMYSLKELSLKKEKVNKKLIAPHFAKKFMNIIKKYGRIFEPGLTPAFIGRVGVGGLIDNTIFGLKMFGKGRLPILPKKINNTGFKKTVKKVNELTASKERS